MQNQSMFISSFSNDETGDAIFNHINDQISVHDIYEYIESYSIIRIMRELNPDVECDDILTIDNIKKYTYKYVDEIASKFNINIDAFERHAYENHI